MPNPPFRLPTPLPGSSGALPGAASDVRPIAQWVEPARSGAGMAVSEVPMSVPGFYYPVAAIGSATSLWLHREDASSAETLTGAVYVNWANTGKSVTIAAGQTEASSPLGMDLAPGDAVQVQVFGANTASVSGVLRTPTRLFRLMPAPLGKVWILIDGQWIAPPDPYLNDAGAWDAPTGAYVVDEAGTWAGVF